MSRTSAAVKNRYNAKAYDRIILAVPKGSKEVYQQLAKSRGVSLTQLIKAMLDKEIEKNA